MNGRRRPGDPYEVGYGKPPKKTQFKRGRSGNPNGRPRKKPDLYSELTKVLHENVTVTIDGESKRLTVQQRDVEVHLPGRMRVETHLHLAGSGLQLGLGRSAPHQTDDPVQVRGRQHPSG